MSVRKEVSFAFTTLHDWLNTIFASLARANKRVHVHNERNFPQAKLDGEINARFLLNGHGNLYFLLHNNSVNTILFNLEKN